MRKFKHKITNNMAVETSSEKNYKVSQPRNFTIPKWIIENSNDWEEIKELQYKILEFRWYSTSFTIGYASATLRENGKWLNDENEKTNGIYEIEDLLKHSNFKIFRVKRISDSTEFKIGDKVYETITGKKDNWEIKEFLLKDERCFSCGININNIEYKKEPLFITFDDVEIFEGDGYYTVFFKETKDKSDPKRWRVLGKFSAEKLVGDDKWSVECNYFSSIEAASNYIELYKPIYSNNDMLKFGKTCFSRGISKDYSVDMVGLLKQYKNE